MKWYKSASDHGDTLNGQLITHKKNEVKNNIEKLKEEAITGGPRRVLPRWRGEIKREILMLPSSEVVGNMSMMELDELEERIDGIENAMTQRSTNDFLSELGEGMLWPSS